MNYFKKRRENKEKKILIDYLNNLNDPNAQYPYWYIPIHQNKIDWIEWLIGYYEGRTASTPKELLEAYLDPIHKTQCHDYSALVSELETIKFIYHWVYYKQITGF